MDSEGHSEQGPGVGALLRATRERVGVDLASVAEALRIRERLLDAIERGHYDQLPGRAYAMGFVRAYAEYLGLDSEEVTRRFRAEFSGTAAQQRLSFPTPVPERGIPGGAVVFIGAVLAILAYGGWYTLSSRDDVVAELIAPLPGRLAALIGISGSSGDPAPEGMGEREVTQGLGARAGSTPREPAAEPAPDAAPPASVAPGAAATVAALPAAALPAGPVAPSAPAPSPTAEPAAQPSPSPGALPAAQPVAEATRAADAPTPTPATPWVPLTDRLAAMAPPPPAAPPAVAPPAVAPPAAIDAPTAVAVPAASPAAPPSTPPAAAPAQVAALPDGPSRITIRARGASWVQVRQESSNGLLVTRLLRAGDVIAVPDRPGLRLHTGNAGALEIVVDGTALPPLGNEGAVLRDVELDPDTLRQGASARR